MAISRLGGAPARTIEIFMAMCLTSCGDTHATVDAPKEQTQLAFTNDGYEICSLHDVGPEIVANDCDPTLGDHYCTFYVHGSVTLEPTCRYRGRLDVRASNVTLDCQGAILEGEHAVDGSGAPDPAAIGIRISKIAANNTTVRNCNLQNFTQGIAVKNSGGSYETSPKNVRVENVHIKNSNMTGIHIYEYVDGVLISNSRVDNSAGPGIHLSPRSRATRVEYSRLYLNGRRSPQHERQVESPSAASPREGLTIDGSNDNQIVDNVFDGNAAGGVYLYSNCGEDGSPDRPEAVNNLIFRNVFKNSPRAIWVAARQSKELSGLACDPTTDPEGNPDDTRTAYAFNANANPINCDEPVREPESARCTWRLSYPTNPDCRCHSAVLCSAADRQRCGFEWRTGAYFHDLVDVTTISKNIFDTLKTYGCSADFHEDHCIRPETTVRVEDDNTTLWKNAFVGYSSGELVRIGTPLRYAHLSQPVLGVVVDGNGYLDMSQATFVAHVRYEYGSGAPINAAPVRTEQACRQDGKVVPPHSSDTFYRQRSGAVCEAEERNCRNGVLSGSFAYATCTPT